MRFAFCDGNFPSIYDSRDERDAWAAYWGAVGDLAQAAADGQSVQAADYACALFWLYEVSDEGDSPPENEDDGRLVNANELPHYWAVVAMTTALGRTPAFAEVFDPTGILRATTSATYPSGG